MHILLLCSLFTDIPRYSLCYNLFSLGIMWWAIAFIIISQTRVCLHFLRASVLKEFLELLEDLSVANQFHLCIAAVANQTF